MRHHRIHTPCAAVLALALCPLAASAATFYDVEGNDTFGAANPVQGGSHTIVGSIGNVDDVDIFRFSLAAGSGFNVTITQNTFDVSMVLLDANGYSWGGNDGWDGPINTTIVNSGTYYLGISAYQNEAVDMFGNFLRDWSWQSDEYTLGTTFAGWSGQAFDFGDYTLSVNSVSAVPVPAAAWLFGSGLTGLIGLARRRRAAA